jgi:hypothetical protein
MIWSIVAAENQQDTVHGLTDDELIAVSIALRSVSTTGDAYRRAWWKIQPQVERAIANQGKRSAKSG